MALDHFLKSCLSIFHSQNPDKGFPQAFLAFLESDICDRSGHYDIISKPDSENEWMTIDTTEDHRMERDMIADKIRTVICSQILPSMNDETVPIPTVALNTMDISGSVNGNLSQSHGGGNLSTPANIAASPHEEVDVRMSDDDIDTTLISNDSIKEIDSASSIINPISKSHKASSFLPKLSTLTAALSTSTNGSSLSTQKLIELPGVLLNDLVTLLQYCGVEEMTESLESWNQFASSHDTSRNITTDEIPKEYSIILDSNLKASDSNDCKDILRPTWLTQWRVQNLLLSTTAFRNIISLTEQLQYLTLKDLATLTESTR